MDLNQRRPRVDNSRFAMIPRPEIPRSTFLTKHTVKTTFDPGYLVPFHVDEVLPGDSFKGRVTVFARLATPVFPVMDYMQIETFFFFVPARLLWDNWKKMMGERRNPTDSISYTVPYISSAAGGFTQGSIYDYFGIPTAGQITGGQSIQVNALPFRAYNRIFNEWFRDQNLQTSLTDSTDDGPDSEGNYALLRRNKKPDYFTSALPWPLKGGVEVMMTLTGNAPVKGIGRYDGSLFTSGAPASAVWETAGTGNDATDWLAHQNLSNAGAWVGELAADADGAPAIYADMTASGIGATINAIRLAFQTQRLLERDARSGTRYTELLRAHFGVNPEDTRLQRPEYIGGGRSPIQTQAIPQTSATTITGGSTPLGALGAAATASDTHSFSYNATEHGYIIGLVHATAEVTYQQGLHRLWTRRTRYDFYWPVFAHLGEQAIRNDELYCTGVDATDTATFGYQERWAEYRHRPSRITGKFKSYATGTIDPWHLSQNFTAQPALNAAFIQDAPPFARVIAAGSAAAGMMILFDSVFQIRTARAMPMYSVPGNLDRF